jgi:hypothetical protein
VIEINQTCATSSAGCFSGDSSASPVTIDGSARRSYRAGARVALSGPAPELAR